MYDTQARAALSALTGPLPVTAAEAVAAERELLKPRLRELVRAVPARRRRQRLVRSACAIGGLMLSASVPLVVWQGRKAAEAAYAFESGSSTPLSNAGRGFATGPRETTALRTRSGALVTVGSASLVESVSAEAGQEQVVLARGFVHVRVPHLAPGGGFSVKTPDALVTVHGTMFTVNVASTPQGTQTCVKVEEGVVWVERPETRVVLKKGESDHCVPSESSETAPSQDTAATPENLATPPSSRAADGRGVISPSVVSRLPKNGSASDATLAEQNRLLAAGLQAEQAGRPAEAKLHLQQLLQRFPDSALRAEAENSLARVEKRAP